jgi:hypothetical protein
MNDWYDLCKDVMKKLGFFLLKLLKIFFNLSIKITNQIYTHNLLSIKQI